MSIRKPSDSRAVPRRILTLPRLTAVAAAVLLVSATISLAADKPVARKLATHTATRQVLVVPDVRGQVFVFASGTLEDAGFGWKVRGSVHGFPANKVTLQQPKPGTRVIDTGAPTITLWLSRGSARELGQPQDRSPYGASLIRRAARHAHTR
jgi:beta-lactam-binding protein with PASTA domain